MSSPIAQSTGNPPAIPFQNAVVTAISSTKVRITGITLRDGESGTIGFAGDEGATMRLLPIFRPSEYLLDGQLVEFAASIEVSAHPLDAADGTVANLVITKGGNPFRITLAAEGDDVSLFELYATSHE